MRLFVVGLILCLLFIPFFQNEQTSQTGSRISTVIPNGHTKQSHLIKQEIIVRFETEPRLQQWQLWQDKFKILYFPHKLPQTYLIRSEQASVADLLSFFQKQKVVYVEPHWLYETNKKIVPNDEFFAKYQWNLPNIGALDGWTITKGNSQIKVAVIDTGIDLTHPDLKAHLLAGSNFLEVGKSANDDNGHGTHVAGIIGASVNNRQGIAGLNWNSQLIPIKALDATGAGSSFSVADGIIEATDQGARVINMSLGNYASSAFLHDAVRYAFQHDVVLVAASGNDDSSQPGYPAAYPEVLAVAATTNQNQHANYSNYGSYVDVCAPGDEIASTYMGSHYAALSGTSMATPHVSALASLVLSTNPKLHNTEVMRIISSTARDVGIRGRDDLFGSGIINVHAALKQAMLSRISPITVRMPVETNPPTPPAELPGNKYTSLFQLILAYLRASFEK